MGSAVPFAASRRYLSQVNRFARSRCILAILSLISCSM
jgi:hypothetical protein